MNLCQPAPGNNQAAVRRVRKGAYIAFDLAWVMHVDRCYLYSNRRCYRLNRAELANPNCQCSIPKDCRSRYVRRNLLEQLQPFCGNAIFVRHETSSVAAWPRKAIDEASTNRIGHDREYNGHCAGDL